MSGIVGYAQGKKGSVNRTRGLYFLARALGVAGVPDANGAWYDNANVGSGVTNALTAARSTGGLGTIGGNFVAPYGFAAYFGNGGGSVLTALITSEAVRAAWVMNAVAPVKPPSTAEVLVYRSRYYHTGTAPTGNLLLGEGFYMGAPTAMNTGFGGGLTAFNSTTFAGIIVCRMATGYFLLYKTAAGVGTLVPLTGLDLAASPALVEHRLYAPTRTAIGRYELWINESKVTEVLASAANFPIPTSISQAYTIIQAIKDNYDGASAGLQKFSSEIILGQDSPDTFAY